MKSAVPPPREDSDIDIAVALPTNVVSDCDKLDPRITTQGIQFQKYCGKDYPRNDAGKLHTASMAECIDACASRSSSCVGVSFEAAMTRGYWNCYLKDATAVIGLTTQSFRMDTAFVVNDDKAASPTSSLASVTSYSQVQSRTESSAGQVSSPASTTDSNLSSPSAGSKAWIAGAVAGPVLGILFIVLVCFFLLRRRRRNAGARDKGVAPWMYAYSKPELDAGHANGMATPLELDARLPRMELEGKPVCGNQVHKAL